VSPFVVFIITRVLCRWSISPSRRLAGPASDDVLQPLLLGHRARRHGLTSVRWQTAAAGMGRRSSSADASATARGGGRFGHLRRPPRGAMGRNRCMCTELHDSRPAGGRRKSLQTECLNAAPLSGGWARLAKPGENRTMQPGCERASRGPRHVTPQLYTSPSPRSSSGPSAMPGVSAGRRLVKRRLAARG
jgi:hypothetical protein